MRLIAGSEVAEAIYYNNEEVLVDNVTLTTAGITVDVRRFPSIHVDVEFDLPNRDLSIEFRKQAGSLLNARRLNVKSGFRTGVSQGGLWRATIPCRGETVFFDTNAAGALLTVVGSQRYTDKISQDIIDADQVVLAHENANYLWSERANILPAANTLAFDLHPWFGSITADIVFSSTAVMGTSRAQWVRNMNGVAVGIRSDAIGADPFTNNYGVTSTIACNGDALRFQIVNDTAVQWNNINSTISPTGGFGL